MRGEGWENIYVYCLDFGRVDCVDKQLVVDLAAVDARSGKLFPLVAVERLAERRQLFLQQPRVNEAGQFRVKHFERAFQIVFRVDLTTATQYMRINNTTACCAALTCIIRLDIMLKNIGNVIAPVYK